MDWGPYGNRDDEESIMQMTCAVVLLAALALLLGVVWYWLVR